MIFIKLSIIAICAVCKWIGEVSWHNAQRFILPVILGIGISLVTHTWWLGLTTLPSIGAICLGYRTFNLGDAGDRGMWLFLIAVILGAGPLLTGHIYWFLYVPWCVICGVWGSTTRNLWNAIIAPISGALLGSIIFLVK